MANFNLYAARAAGAKDEEIAAFLAEQRNFDYAGAKAAGANDAQIAEFLSLDKQIGAGETFARGLERGLTSSMRGIMKVLPDRVSGVTAPTEGEQVDPEAALLYGMGDVPAQLKSDTDIELEFRLAREQSPWAGYGGQIIGSIADPLGWIVPTKKAETLGELATQGAKMGFVGGALEPVYTELGDTQVGSRLANIAGGTAGGYVLGGALGKVADTVSKKFTGKGIFDTEASKVVPDPEAPKGEPDIVTQSEAVRAPDPFVPLTDSEVARLADIRYRVETGQPTTQAELRYYLDTGHRLNPVGEAESEFYRIQTKINKGELLSAEEAKFARRYDGVVSQAFPDNAPIKTQEFIDGVLDETSKNMYNIGGGYGVGTKGQPLIKEETILPLLPQLQSLNPSIKTTSDAAAVVAGYRKFVDAMRKTSGELYQPRSFEDFVTKGISLDERITLHENKFFSGCYK